MPSFYSRLNLSSSIFPFYTEAAGRSIMMPQMDENWDRYNAASTTKDKGVPQVFYMHNCVPIADGFQSISYDTQLSGMPGATDFTTAYNLFDQNGAVYIFVPAAGKNYIYDGNVGSWKSYPFPAGAVEAATLVTTAYVKGTTYILYAGYGCFKYTPSTTSFDPVTLTGLTISTIVSICSANGYMIAASSNAVAWSSLTDPTNFTPSIQTGAGGGVVQDAKGEINFILTISDGWVAYCKNNIVGGQYTGNTAYPYIVKESSGSGGVDSIDKVAYQGTLPYHIALTTAGIQQVTVGSSSPTFPELSDFLTAQFFEDFNETSLTFSSQYLPGPLVVKLSVVSARYIMISYGVNAGQFTHALVFDVMLNRFGKFKINHCSTFTYNNPIPSSSVSYTALMGTPISSLGDTTYRDLFTNFVVPSLPKKNVGFMGADGTVYTVNFQVGEDTADGVFLIGKFQLQRTSQIIHQRTSVESVRNTNTFQMYLLPTFNGKDFAPAVPTVANESGTLERLYAKRFTATNISLLMMGAFNLTSIVAQFSAGGSR